MAVDLTKNQDELSKAWKWVVDQNDKQNWALFGYEGNTNIIKHMSSGDNGLVELVQELNNSLIQYAFCRVIDGQSNLNKLILINWQGDSSPLSRKGLCASHVGDVVSFFKGCSQTITIRNDDEATPEYIISQISKPSSVKINLSRESDLIDKNDTPVISSTYKKTDIKSEIPKDRKSFWQMQEEEEKKRIAEEKKRAEEKQAQFERERKSREESETKKLAETIKERDRLIEATRQAELRESPKSVQSSLVSQSVARDDDDDCVGRRSDLIRLERNQETLSLIGKGSIKNKRAIFEQELQQQSVPKQSSQPSSIGSNSQRRPSGTVVSQRLEAFQSLDYNNANSTSVEKLSNGLATKVSVSEAKPKMAVEVESVTTNLTPETGAKEPESDESHVKQPDVHEDGNKAPAKVVNGSNDAKESNGDQVITRNGSMSNTNGHNDDANDVGKTKNHINKTQESIIKSSPKQQADVELPEVKADHGIRAKALYDYQAGDAGEISFDPGDMICHIEKVDPGWWHGSVATGRFKGQVGLFPFNYVSEMP